MSELKQCIQGLYECESGQLLAEGLFPRANLEKVKSFDMAEGDVVVATYPKAGRYSVAQWTLQKINWLLIGIL